MEPYVLQLAAATCADHPWPRSAHAACLAECSIAGCTDDLLGKGWNFYKGAAVGFTHTYFYLFAFLIGTAVVFLASEFGWRLGIRTDGHGASGNISALEQSLLGFLALIVGFTFLMALTRFETRREAVLNEANAIGTTALRARLLPDPHRTETLKLLREYAQVRIDYIPTGRSFAELPTLIVAAGESNFSQGQ
jgi:hypothetical protein